MRRCYAGRRAARVLGRKYAMAFQNSSLEEVVANRHHVIVLDKFGRHPNKLCADESQLPVGIAFKGVESRLDGQAHELLVPEQANAAAGNVLLACQPLLEEFMAVELRLRVSFRW
ncbi:hypothetical protein TGCAST_390170 [Toxoplasma gondii CAST]|uniref:Uncharacterized protein n=1 Tax=Toxoplasma gondii CAST TaxID=943122 RepID=A0A425HLL0_TOXGO|nr:hypothetical protein TGCAST_390170 [Toxoplasma gondii CAST]